MLLAWLPWIPPNHEGWLLLVPMETRRPEEHPVISDKTPNFSCWVAQTLMFKNRSRQQPLILAAGEKKSACLKEEVWGGGVCVCWTSTVIRKMQINTTRCHFTAFREANKWKKKKMTPNVDRVVRNSFIPAGRRKRIWEQLEKSWLKLTHTYILWDQKFHS